MTVPLLRPGQTHDAVPRMKHALVRELLKLGLTPLAEPVALDSKTYGPAAVTAVEAFQQRRHLHGNGVVDKDTWHALGIDEPVADVSPVFHDGRVVIAPEANLPDRPIQAITLKYVAQMAALLEKPITITTGRTTTSSPSTAL